MRVERFSGQLADLVDTLDLSDVLLLGHSHGGFVVQHFALANPERVAGIILYDSSAVTGGEFMMAAGEGVAAFAQPPCWTPRGRGSAEGVAIHSRHG